MRTAGGLEYEDRGNGQASLLIHGAAIADAFAPLSREVVLAERYRLIRYRRRGYGGSEPVCAPLSLNDQAGDAAALLQRDVFGIR